MAIPLTCFREKPLRLSSSGSIVPINIAVDCMGGDHGPAVTLPAVARFLASHADACATLVGREALVMPLLAANGLALGPRVQFKHAEDVVGMDESPLDALRKKKDSSMRVAAKLVKDGQAHAAVSAGNTGAWMATARYVLKTLPGIDRPALCSPLPNRTGGATFVLDLGANVDCTPEQLFQFALMGSALVGAVNRNTQPSVGLLNVGEEDIKGNEVVKATAELLKVAQQRGELNFFGNVEGDDIFKGTADVVVCDGFVGNVALKTAEGVAKMLTDALKEELTANPLRRLAAATLMPALKSFKRRFDPGRHNGASFLGLNGIAVKSHGGADAPSFATAISYAYEMVKEDVLGRIAAQVAASPGAHQPARSTPRAA
jgi:phosphate acyltransferase